LVVALKTKVQKYVGGGERDFNTRTPPYSPPTFNHPSLQLHSQGVKMYILTLGVLAPYRGMKVGTRLLQRSLSFLSTNLPEVTHAYLHVHTANQDAIDFYQKFGFEVEGGVIEKYYKRLDPPDAVLLVKRIATSK